MSCASRETGCKSAQTPSLLSWDPQSAGGFAHIGAAHDMAEPPVIARQRVAQSSILAIRVRVRR